MITTKTITRYLEVLSNFTNKSLEWEFPDKQLGTLLVLANFSIQNYPQLKLYNGNLN